MATFFTLIFFLLILKKYINREHLKCSISLKKKSKMKFQTIELHTEKFRIEKTNNR